jgi:threonine/homoserine/homoserine lactone efflux protein
MLPLYEGIKVGMVLCFLLGPIFFALVQTGIEQGVRAGVTLGLGVWVSDFLFISAVFYGLSHVTQLSESVHFKTYLGIGGGLVLAAFGLATLFSKPPHFDFGGNTARHSSYFSLWLKGFAINTLNPFSLIFWAGWMSAILIKGTMSTHETYLFFGGTLGTIAATDTLKVLMAKRIRRLMRPVHLLWFRRLSSLALVIFGIVLLFKVL